MCDPKDHPPFPPCVCPSSHHHVLELLLVCLPVYCTSLYLSGSSKHCHKHPKPRSSTQHKFASGSSNNSVQPFGGQTSMGRFGVLGFSISVLCPPLTHSPYQPASNEDRERSPCVGMGGVFTSRAQPSVRIQSHGCPHCNGC